MIKKTFIFITLVAIFSIPALTCTVFAESGSNVAVNLSAELDNPLGVKSITELITNLLKIVAELGAIICVFFIIYSGFLFIKAQGNEGELTKAKSVFFWSVIGTAVLLGASVVAEIITGTVESITG
jgi:hypothetical protein